MSDFPDHANKVLQFSLALGVVAIAVLSGGMATKILEHLAKKDLKGIGL